MYKRHLEELPPLSAALIGTLLINWLYIPVAIVIGLVLRLIADFHLDFWGLAKFSTLGILLASIVERLLVREVCYTTRRQYPWGWRMTAIYTFTPPLAGACAGVVVGGLGLAGWGALIITLALTPDLFYLEQPWHKTVDDDEMIAQARSFRNAVLDIARETAKERHARSNRIIEEKEADAIRNLPPRLRGQGFIVPPDDKEEN